jgi:dTDP-4-dehydrorhamnose reductase
MGRPALDLADPSSVSHSLDAVRPDWVINAAAYTAVDRAESEPDLAFAINRNGVGDLAAAAARHDAPLIHISTDYVFDGTKPGAYTEADKPNPVSVYGRSKLEGEYRVASGNSRHLILRTSWVYSEHGGNFVKTMLRLASERPELKVVADQYGNPTYAGDLASAIFDLIGRIADAQANGVAWGVYHATGHGTTNWHGLAERIVQESSYCGRRSVPVWPIATADFPTAARRPANSTLDCGKLEATFGIRLPTWSESVKRCVRKLCEANS